ncbi:MAG: hypothetical protein HY549_06890 [Elusimicrobia bacterium]|nr:hypothetical protein [Elusimicrobiota bacterium]
MEFPEGIKEEDNRVPWALKLVYIAIVLFCFWYLAVSLRWHGTEAVTSLDNQVQVR